MQGSKFKIQNVSLVFCILHLAFYVACSVPNLEKPDCVDAREAMRVFYSFHYANDMKFNRENLTLRQKFLTPELFQTLAQKPDSQTDYFTASDEPPKAFRIGNCTIVEPDKKTALSVVFFWRDNQTEQSRQQEVQVEAVKENNEWLIDKVEAR